MIPDSSKFESGSWIFKLLINIPKKNSCQKAENGCRDAAVLQCVSHCSQLQLAAAWALEEHHRIFHRELLTLMKHGCSALLSTPVHTTDFQQMRLRSVLKYSSSTWSSCPQARKLTLGTFFNLQTPRQRGCFNHLPSVANMEYGLRYLHLSAIMCAPSRL